MSKDSINIYFEGAGKKYHMFVAGLEFMQGIGEMIDKEGKVLAEHVVDNDLNMDEIVLCYTEQRF